MHAKASQLLASDVNPGAVPLTGSEAELAAALERAASDRSAMQRQLDEAHDQVAVHRHEADAARAELRVTQRQLEVHLCSVSTRSSL